MEKALIVSVMYVSLLIPTAFAQSDIGNLIEEGFNKTIDKFTEDLDYNNPNILNTTEKETQDLKDSGLEMVGSGIEMIKSAHGFAKSLVQFLSPAYVDEWILFIIAGAIAVLIAISVIKRMFIHIILFVVIALFIIGLLIFFYY